MAESMSLKQAFLAGYYWQRAGGTLEKTALEDPVNAVVDAGGKVIKTIGGLGAAGLGLAAVGGGGLGYLAAKLRSNPQLTPKEIQQQELIAAYNAHREQIEQSRLARQRPPSLKRLSVTMR